jgi:hypothetical protein
LAFARQVIYLACLHVEPDDTPPRVVIGNRQGCALPICNFFAREVGHEHRFTGHYSLLERSPIGRRYQNTYSQSSALFDTDTIWMKVV